MSLPDLASGLPYTETLLDPRDALRRNMDWIDRDQYPFGRPELCADGYVPPGPLICTSREHSQALAAIGYGTKWTPDMQLRTGYRKMSFAECYNTASDDDRTAIRRLFPEVKK